MLNFLFVLHGSHFWGMESCFILFIPVLKIYLGAAILKRSYQALQRVATVHNQSLTFQLCFGFKSLLLVQREPPAAHRARPGLREALAMPFAGRAGLAPGAGPWLAVPQRPRLESHCQLSATCLVPAWKLSVPCFFSSLWDAVPCFLSTSCSRWNPKSITLSKKCL